MAAVLESVRMSGSRLRKVSATVEATIDPHREAILLLGGDTAEGSQSNDWYVTAVPAADALYENYLDETGRIDEETN